MKTALAILVAYLAAGLLVAVIWRRRHGALNAGQWALLILGWPLVLLVDYAADRENW